MAFSRATRAALALVEALPYLGVCLVDAGNGVLATTVAKFTIRLDESDRVLLVPVEPLTWTIVDRSCIAVGVRRPTDGTYEPLREGPQSMNVGDVLILDDYSRVVR